MEVWWLTRALVIVGILFIGIVITPRQSITVLNVSRYSACTVGFVRTTHLLSFGIAWGVSVWNSFLGDYLIHNTIMSRKHFQSLVNKIFPIYFKVQAISTAICLLTFATAHSWTSPTVSERQQIGALGSTMMLCISNMLLFDPLSRKLLREKRRMKEEDATPTSYGGAEIVRVLRVSRGFSSLANLFAVGGLAVHAWYLASRMLL